MRENFKLALAWLMDYEGGVSNDKYDPGGLTKWGVTHIDYDHYRSLKGLPRRLVTSMTEAEFQDIYLTFYWNVCQCDAMAPGVDACVFDMAVNNGVVGAAKAAQRVASRLLGKVIDVDGHIGPITLASIQTCDPIQFIDAFCAERLRLDRTFKNWFAFGKGWTARDAKVKSRTESLAGKAKELVHG